MKVRDFIEAERYFHKDRKERRKEVSLKDFIKLSGRPEEVRRVAEIPEERGQRTYELVGQAFCSTEDGLPIPRRPSVDVGLYQRYHEGCCSDEW